MRFLGFDKLIRFTFTREIINQNWIEGEMILDVGGGADSALKFLKKRGIVLDYGNFKSFKKGSILYQFYNDSERFPITDDYFYYVICLDTLEHIPRKNRRKFISELCRVSKKYVLIINPTAYLHYEKYFLKLAEIYSFFGLKAFKKYYNEHRIYKIPLHQEIEVYFKENNCFQKFGFKFFGKRSNLVMFSQYLFPFLAISFFNKLLLHLFPLKQISKESSPIYSCFFYSKKED